MRKLEGKTAIVTGASSGIGAAIAKELAAEGANVILAARTQEKLNDVKTIIDKQGKGKVLAVQADVSSKDEVTNMVEKAVEQFGEVDILVNNAGQMLTGTVQSGKVEEWEHMIDVNIK